jgi:hypothetical protein
MDYLDEKAPDYEWNLERPPFEQRHQRHRPGSQASAVDPGFRRCQPGLADPQGVGSAAGPAGRNARPRMPPKITCVNINGRTETKSAVAG